MSDRRQQLADAALRVLADGGSRDLTHRAVDAEAGVPAGSTSNYFRTRDALITAIADRLEELDRIEAGRLLATPPQTLEQVADLLAAFAEWQTSEKTAQATRARLELATILDLSAQHQRLLTTFATVLAGVGVSDPPAAARRAADYLDGVVLHAVTIPGRVVDPDEVRAAAYALLRLDQR